MADDDAITNELRGRLEASPFHRWAGMSVLAARPGEVEIALAAAPHHLNLHGTLHGGILATLADTATGLAVRTRLEPGRTHVTASLTVQYLRSGAPGSIVARGRVVRLGRSLAHAAAEIADAEGRVLATALAAISLGREQAG